MTRALSALALVLTALGSLACSEPAESTGPGTSSGASGTSSGASGTGAGGEAAGGMAGSNGVGGNAGAQATGGTQAGGGQAGASGASGASGAAGASGTGGELGPREPNTGPGAPQVTFTDDQLFQVCATVNGGDPDLDHHNMVSMYDGYMMMPWAHEAGHGGISFYDISAPCTPVRTGYGYSDLMRESHTIALSNIGGRWLFTAHKTASGGGGGIQVWNISDVTQPSAVRELEIQGHNYPNAYDYVVLAVAPQGRYLYVAAGFLGILVIDAANPMEPSVVATYQVTPQFRAMQVIPVGNLLFASAAEGARVLMLDISNPTDPQPLPGGDFNVSVSGVVTNSYSSNLNGGRAYFTRQSGTGGLVIYDIDDPTQAALLGAFDDVGGNGGYVFFQEPYAFAGNSGFFSLYDVSDPASVALIDKFQLHGDMDTITPIGNIALLSEDVGAVNGQASGVAPWATAPDTKPPVVNWSYPASGTTGLALSSRIGITLTEAVDAKSVWRPGAVRVYPTNAGPAASIAGDVSLLDTVVNFSPAAPLQPQTEYTLEVVPGGIEDYSGNAIEQGFSMTFTTGG